MKNFLTILFAFLSVTVLSQPFEGKITYQIVYTSKIPNVSDEQLTAMMGSRQDYLIKGGNYKSITNGTLLLWQLYLNADNKLYTKMPDSDVILWNDGDQYNDTVLSVELNRDVAEILEYRCDELILKCQSGIQKYYFNSKLGVDVSLFTKHQYGNWYDYLKLAKALPLKSVVDTEQFSFTSFATEVKAMKIDDSEFKLPANSKTTKNPY